MAGFSKLYCIGGLGGYMGADGINPILLQILVGDADRQWLEPHYFDTRIRPLGRIRTIVPQGPDHPLALLDACIAFFPAHFRDCPSLVPVEQKVREFERLDFHLGAKDIPAEWPALRQEALPYFRALNIFEAHLVRMRLEAFQV